MQPATEEEVGRMRTFTNYDSEWHKVKFLGSLEEGPIVKISVPAAHIITAQELENGKRDE